MNLDQLYQLRNRAKGNDKKVISKETFLTVLDSHIRLLNGQNDSSIIREHNEPVKVTQGLKTAIGMEQVRVPPTHEQVSKVYNQMFGKW